MDRSFDAGPIAVRICLAALIGCCSGFMFFATDGFGMLRSGAATTYDAPAWSLSQIYISVLATIFYIIIAFIAILPFLLLAVAAGILMRRWIARYPLTWAVFASLITWITTLATMMARRSANEWAMNHSAMERLTYNITSSDSMLVMVGAFGAGLSFYLLGLAHQRMTQRA